MTSPGTTVLVGATLLAAGSITFVTARTARRRRALLVLLRTTPVRLLVGPALFYLAIPLGNAVAGARGAAAGAGLSAIICFTALATTDRIRPYVRFWPRLTDRLAFRRAGVKDWMVAAYLYRAHVTPAQIRDLQAARPRERRLTQQHLNHLAEILYDRPGRADAALSALSVSPAPPGDILTALDDILRLQDSTAEIAAYLSIAGLPLKAVTRLMAHDVPATLAALIAGLPAATGVRHWPAAFGGLWERLDDPQFPHQVLADWITVRDAVLSTAMIETTARTVHAWQDAAGDLGPWCWNAGLGLDEARAMRAAGTLPDRQALTVLAALAGRQS